MKFFAIATLAASAAVAAPIPSSYPSHCGPMFDGNNVLHLVCDAPGHAGYVVPIIESTHDAKGNPIAYRSERGFGDEQASIETRSPDKKITYFFNPFELLPSEKRSPSIETRSPDKKLTYFFNPFELLPSEKRSPSKDAATAPMKRDATTAGQISYRLQKVKEVLRDAENRVKENLVYMEQIKNSNMPPGLRDTIEILHAKLEGRVEILLKQMAEEEEALRLAIDAENKAASAST